MDFLFCRCVGAELFAKRRKRSEKWIVDETTRGTGVPSATSYSAGPTQLYDNTNQYNQYASPNANQVMIHLKHDSKLNNKFPVWLTHPFFFSLEMLQRLTINRIHGKMIAMLIYTEKQRIQFRQWIAVATSKTLIIHQVRIKCPYHRCRAHCHQLNRTRYQRYIDIYIIYLLYIYCHSNKSYANDNDASVEFNEY